ncbi:MAG: hypothetical protein AAGH40_05170 [Verrucomicrobiota bacterium]
MSGIANSTGSLKTGGGAQFWVYLSPQNNTAEVIKTWSVTFSQGNWSDSITSEDPTKQIQTPNLSGEFDLKVTQTDYSTNPPREVDIPAKAPSTNVIGCNSNCASMVGIVADETPVIGGAQGTFWTTWDAFCS